MTTAGRSSGDRADEEHAYLDEDEELERYAEGVSAEGAGRPGPADEVPRPSTRRVAGAPGPADEVPRPSTQDVAGQPGPADEVDRSG